ncbi:MAG: DHHA1 domain-containing protein, partial [Gemmataceae bacterium]|nr:DHHA1 domain-containing protein [Gemmataceae bacterium]MDW8267460.1 DHHA1 domain-containing protein [Gemmataceae bacterium]
THLHHTGQAGFFKIVSQEAVGKGVRRVTAVTGREAVAVVQRLAAVVDDLAAKFSCKPEELASRVDSLQEELKRLQQQLRKGAAADLAGVADRLLAEAPEVRGSKIIVGEVPAAPIEQMRGQIDRLRQKAGSAAIVLGWVEDGRVMLLAGVTRDLEAKVSAGEIVKEIAPIVGGKGGGRADMAQAGGKEPGKLAEALQRARERLKDQLA